MNPFLQFWRWLLGLFYTRNLKVVLLGLPMSGKTTLVHAFKGEDTELDPIPTIGAENSSYKQGNVRFDILDLSGAPSYASLWEGLCKSSDIILFVIDSANQENVTSSKNQLTLLLQNQELADKHILVIANKQDLPEAIKRDEIIARLKLDEFRDRTDLFLVSAKRKTHVEDIIEWLIRNT